MSQENIQDSLLRFMTCGSVDDGKSTLIGRLLFDTKNQTHQPKISSVAFDHCPRKFAL